MSATVEDLIWQASVEEAAASENAVITDETQMTKVVALMKSAGGGSRG